MLIDSHCHLDFPDFAEDIGAVLVRAAAAGVGLMVTISTRLDRFPGVLDIAERHANVYCSVGVHPHEADGAADLSVERLVGLTRHPKVVAIGEAGLDYYYDHSDRAAQHRVFELQIEAARATGLPLIVHTRDAEADTMALLAEGAKRGGLTGLLHCFSGSQVLADFALEIGFAVSFSGIVTFKRAEDLRAIARTIPAQRLLVETDAPYLAPVPHRGKRNEPAFVAQTAAALAALRGETVEDIARATTDCFFRMFRKVPRSDLSGEVRQAS